jgi:hypothetical protein
MRTILWQRRYHIMKKIDTFLINLVKVSPACYKNETLMDSAEQRGPVISGTPGTFSFLWSKPIGPDSFGDGNQHM